MRPYLWFSTAIAAGLSATLSLGQQSSAQIHLVMAQGNGAITVTSGNDWKPSGLSLYDKGTRPVIQLKNSDPSLTVSYILFASSNATSESCREDVMKPLMESMGTSLVPKSLQRGETTTADGKHLMTASYTLYTASAEIANAVGVDMKSDNLFGFYGGGSYCAEVHISQLFVKPGRSPLMDAALKSFTVLPDYKPSLQDYVVMGVLYFRDAHDAPAAALYYDRALDLVPSAPQDQQRNLTRYLIDQASMSYGMAGDLKKSRALNEAAIAKDPDYPMYYYDLACADAEASDAGAARGHLQQAFYRRANVLKGEALPDPTKDDSILKLKSDKKFWTFVEALPKQ